MSSRESYSINGEKMYIKYNKLDPNDLLSNPNEPTYD